MWHLNLGGGGALGFPFDQKKLRKSTWKNVGPQKERIFFQSPQFSGAFAVGFRECNYPEIDQKGIALQSQLPQIGGRKV